jgi:hypothetical protein
MGGIVRVAGGQSIRDLEAPGVAAGEGGARGLVGLCKDNEMRLDRATHGRVTIALSLCRSLSIQVGLAR